MSKRAAASASVALQQAFPAGCWRPAPYLISGHAFRIFRAAGGQDIILEEEDGLKAARVTLAGATPSKLAVDAARFIALHGDHVQATRCLDAGTEGYVGAASGHVGGNGDAAPFAGVTDQFGLFLVQDGPQFVYKSYALLHKGRGTGIPWCIP